MHSQVRHILQLMKPVIRALLVRNYVSDCILYLVEYQTTQFIEHYLLVNW